MARGEISGVTPCLRAKSARNSCRECAMTHKGGSASRGPASAVFLNDGSGP